MSALVDAVSADIPDACQSKKCSAKGCALKLDRLTQERVLIAVDCDALGLSSVEKQKKCDFVVVGGENCVVPIELKRGQLEAAEVARQLQAGAKLSEQRIAPLAPDSGAIHFRPVAVSNGMKPAQREALRQKSNRVRFGNVLYEIMVTRCGASLADVIPELRAATRRVSPPVPRRRRRTR